MDRQSNADRVFRRRRRASAPEGEWSEETTAVYRADPKRDGPHAWVLGQSVEAIFERARRIGVPLPTAFIFAVYIQACSELAGAGRRPPRHKEERRADPELGPDRIFVGFDGLVKIDWADHDGDAPGPTASERSRRSYRSPEQLRGLPTSGRSDLFSLALTISELFVLKRLSDGRGSITDSEGGTEFADLLRKGMRIPRELGSMLLKSLALDVEQRPFGVTSLTEDLERIGNKLGLRVHPSMTASHMRRLFFDAPAPPDLPDPPAPPALPTEVRENRGSLDLFASLPKPAPPKGPGQLLPPPIAAEPRHTSMSPMRPSSRPPPPPPIRPSPPSTRPSPPRSRVQSMHARPQESEPPPGLARTLPPAQAQPVVPRPSSPAPEAPSWALSRPTKALVALLVVAAVAFPFVKTGPGKVFIAAAGHWGEPLPNAVTVIDGEQRCAGARCTFEVAAGVHEVTAGADGYVPQLQLIAVRSRELAAVNFKLERGGSALKISGQPDGSSVALDGERIGKLPMDIELAPGTHRLRVEAEHFVPEERDIEVTLGETKRLGDIALQPVMGKATFDVRTPGTEVALISGSDRKDLDVGQPIELDLSRKWILEAKRAGFLALREPLDWSDGLEKTFVVALDRAPAPRYSFRRALQGAPASTPGQHSAPNSPDALRAAMQRAIERDTPSTAAGAGDAPPYAEPVASVSNDPCRVSFNSIPVSNVFVDNVRLGVTPILKAGVRPGSHVAQFIAGDAKKAKSFVCKPGELKVVAISLNR
jgi:PEGA domain